MIAGYSNAGKTTITQAMAFAVAMGLPAWGRFAVRRCRVLHVDYEAGQVARENYARLANAYGVPLPDLKQWLRAGEAHTYLNAPTAEAWLIDLIRCSGAELVIIDVFRASTGGVDENKPEIAIPLYLLGRVSRATGAAILALHHERKPDGEKRTAAEHMISGHNAIHGALQAAMSLVRDDTSGLVHASASKRIRSGFEPFALRFVDVPSPHAPAPAEGAAIAAAGQASWGLRVEFVAPAAGVASAPKDPIVEAGQRILEFLRRRAPNGEWVPVQIVRTEVTARAQYQQAAIERLVAGEAILRSSGTPKQIALRTAASTAALVPGAYAPPVAALVDPLISAAELQGDYAAALGAAAEH
jgi:hypothetical protein